MKPIKNIIFDFGDVFLNLDKPATNRYLSKYGIKSLDEKTIQIHKDYERGLLSSQEFIDFHTQNFPVLSENDFVTAWNSILKDFPSYRLDFLKQLKNTGQYKLYLLSNTNDLHIKWVEENISVYQSFQSLFDVFYLSYEINLRKPDADIFQFVLDQNSLEPTETLFVDDTLEHINSAKSLNLHTWHLQVGQQDVVDLFKQKQFNF